MAETWLSMSLKISLGQKQKVFPYSGIYIGLESEWVDYRFTPEDYVASDDKVVAYGSYTGTYKITGKSFAARVAHVWRLKEGKIIKFEQFVDSQHVNDAMK
jgi:ketosteroid isomerase-like protein